jgi:carbamoyltransferase
LFATYPVPEIDASTRGCYRRRVIVLGIGINWHDPSAALLAEGEVVAAVEQERFSRNKHGHGELPIDAARYCLEAAGVSPDRVDVVAFPWSVEGVKANRWAYARRNWSRIPGKAWRMIYGGTRRERRRLGRLRSVLRTLEIDPDRVRIECVEHHLAHASSAYHFSGFESSAIVTIDGMGEVTSSMFAVGEGDRIRKLYEIQKPDSLGLFYSTMTQYLGFEIADGEYKLMGMAPYGDPDRIDLSDIVRVRNGDMRLDLDYVWSPHGKRFGTQRFGRKLVERLGPPRQGDSADEPYIHIAAATQRTFEETALALIDHHLGAHLEQSRRLCFAGGCALNVSLNRLLAEDPRIDELYVAPGASDSGIAIGAAAYAAVQHGERLRPMRHAYYGPEFSTRQIEEELDSRRISYRRVEDPAALAAELLADGEIVAWFQGRMEFGPRALGNRSILGHPGRLGTADEINERIKYRERWRPFCPSVLEEYATQILGTKHPAPFMTYAFRVAPAWRDRIPEVVHVDGTLRPHAVSAATNPRFHRLISKFHERTGLPCVINTSLNRRGEPIVCTPHEALAMFYGSGLEHLFLEDLYVCKRLPVAP